MPSDIRELPVFRNERIDERRFIDYSFQPDRQSSTDKDKFELEILLDFYGHGLAGWGAQRQATRGRAGLDRPPSG